MLTRSTPAAPRFRLTALKACRISRAVILPVSECTLILLMVSLSCFAIREFGLAGFGGRFLASPLSSGVLRVSRQERGRANLGLQPGRLTFLMDSRAVLLLQSVFPFTRLAVRYSGSAAALNEEAAKAAFSSPPRRPAVSPEVYRRDLPTVGRCRASPVMVQDHFLQAATRTTMMVRDRHSARSIPRRGFGSPSTLLPGAVFGDHPGRNAVSRSLPAWPLRPNAFSGPPGGAKLAAYPADNCGVRAESSVRCGPAQVGFGLSYPPFIASPFLLVVYLVPSHCGSRTSAGASSFAAKVQVTRAPRAFGVVLSGGSVTAL